jgi:hypothetical protein
MRVAELAVVKAVQEHRLPSLAYVLHVKWAFWDAESNSRFVFLTAAVSPFVVCCCCCSSLSSFPAVRRQTVLDNTNAHLTT